MKETLILSLSRCLFLDSCDIIITNIGNGSIQKRTLLKFNLKIIIYYIIIKMASAWIEHVKAFAKKNKITYKEAMSKAKPSYKKKDTTKSKKMTKKEMDKMDKMKK